MLESQDGAADMSPMFHHRVQRKASLATNTSNLNATGSDMGSIIPSVSSGSPVKAPTVCVLLSKLFFFNQV